MMCSSSSSGLWITLLVLFCFLFCSVGVDMPEQKQTAPHFCCALADDWMSVLAGIKSETNGKSGAEGGPMRRIR